MLHAAWQFCLVGRSAGRSHWPCLVEKWLSWSALGRERNMQRKCCWSVQGRSPQRKEIYSKGFFGSPMRSVTVFSYIFFPQMERYYLNKKMSLFKASVISKLQSVILAPCLLELTLFAAVTTCPSLNTASGRHPLHPNTDRFCPALQPLFLHQVKTL